MGCTSSTQTAAQDTTRPIQQEKSNGAATTGAAKENRTVEEDSVTIPDQTQAEVAQPTTSESPVEPSVVAAPKSTEFGDKVPADAPGHAAEAEASAPKAEAEAKALAPKAEAEAEASAPKAEAEAEAEASAPKAEAEAEASAPKAEAEAKAPAPKAQAPIDAQPAEGPADVASAPDSSEPAPDTQGDKAVNTTETEEAAASLPKPEAASE